MRIEMLNNSLDKKKILPQLVAVLSYGHNRLILGKIKNKNHLVIRSLKRMFSPVQDEIKRTIKPATIQH